jgi:hypothetical protein
MNEQRGRVGKADDRDLRIEQHFECVHEIADFKNERTRRDEDVFIVAIRAAIWSASKF